MRPLGGVAREWNFLQELRKKDSREIFPVSVGATFTPMPIDPHLSEYHSLKSDYLVEALNELGTRAISPALSDFHLGRDKIRKLQAASKFPWISANLVDPKTKKPLFDRYRVFPGGAYPLVITGVAAGVNREDVMATDPIAALKAVLSELPPGPKFLLVLGSVSNEQRTSILAAVPEISFFVSPDDGAGFFPLEQIHAGTLISGLPIRGRQLGLLKVFPRDTHALPSPLYSAAVSDLVAQARNTKAQDIHDFDLMLAKRSLKRKDRKDFTKLRAAAKEYLVRSADIPLSDPGKGTAFEFELVDLDDKLDAAANPLTELLERFKKAVHDKALASDTSENSGG
jgi:hypothetical protein